MDYFSILRQLWLSVLVLFVFFDQVGCKRGGISIGRSRGASGARGRGGSGGIFGGYKNSGGAAGSSGGGWNQGAKSHIGSSGGLNSQGSRPNYKSQGHGGGYGSGGNYGGSSGFGRNSGPKYTKSGVGSFVRSNTFKNAIVGAAAGYLTYQAGKAIIRNVMAPMMYGGRPYYWGSSYYPRNSMASGGQMCRMPLEPSDPQFGNVFLPDNSRPKEIVWSCGYNEYCCGSECCRGNGASGFGGYGTYGGFGIGSLIVVLLLICCSFYLVRKFCLANSNRYAAGRAV